MQLIQSNQSITDASNFANLPPGELFAAQGNYPLLFDQEDVQDAIAYLISIGWNLGGIIPSGPIETQADVMVEAQRLGGMKNWVDFVD